MRKRPEWLKQALTDHRPLDREEVAWICNWQESTLADLNKTGLGPKFVIDHKQHKIVYPLGELDAFILRNRWI